MGDLFIALCGAAIGLAGGCWIGWNVCYKSCFKGGIHISEDLMKLYLEEDQTLFMTAINNAFKLWTLQWKKRNAKV